jgi:serine/threonine-protein kinase
MRSVHRSRESPITPEAWRAVLRIFGRAIKLEHVKRASYLTGACGDKRIRREVDSLLAAHRREEQVFGLYTSLRGKVLAHYEILERLGPGGMSIVYRAIDRRLGRSVAIKVLDPLEAGDPAAQKRLVSEARLASALNHPNIVTVHEAGRSKGLCFIAMEYVAGKTLDQGIIPARGWPVEVALGYAGQIATALAVAHKQEIVHGDLKPANVLITEAGQIKLIDFGLARVLSQKTNRRGKPERRFGTKAFMAPELLMDPTLDPDPRAEIFSYGLILFKMLSGKHPFGPTGDRQLVVQKICHTPPARLPKKCGASLADIVHCCLCFGLERLDRLLGVS